MAGQPGVEPARTLRERREVVVAGGEPGPGADGCDVVQVAPRPLELEQDRAGAGQLRRRHEAERLLAGVRVGDAVRDGAGRARARDEGRSLLERLPLGRPLEPSVLVEEARVEVEDPVADDMEAEVPGLDHARVDRADRDLVRVVSLDRNRPARKCPVE